jgi:flagellar motor switch protein FliN
MTESAMVQPPEPGEFLQLWSTSFSQVLGQVAGAEFPCAVEKEGPADLPALAADDFWIVVTCSGSLRGEMRLRLPGSVALRLAQVFMSEPISPEAQLGAEHREAVVELFRQVCGVVSSGGKERWGEFQLLVEAAAAVPSWPSAAMLWLRAGEPTSPTVIEVSLSAALVAQLRDGKGESISAQPAPETDNKFTSPSDDDSEGGTGTLDLLMDVQLAMTLRFGSKTLLLRDVLDLSPGAVVELDRRVQEPVELFLDGKLIGRGEVVVIEGNYGLRVSEISPPGSGNISSNRGMRDQG